MNPEEHGKGAKEQASTSRQFNERSCAPIATRAMTITEIKAHRDLLMQRFGYTNEEDLIWKFEKIQDEKDVDREDCLWLKYLMKVEKKGKIEWRECFTLKIPIPEKLRKAAAEFAKTNREHRPRQRGVKPKALPAPDTHTSAVAGAATPTPTPTITEPAEPEAPVPARPRARKPMVKK